METQEGSRPASTGFSWRGLGEIVGTVGVVLGLVFVGTEIRQNTLASRAQARQALAAQNWDFLLRIAEDGRGHDRRHVHPSDRHARGSGAPGAWSCSMTPRSRRS